MKSINYEKILIFLWVCILISINSSYTTTLQLTNINVYSIFSKSSLFIFFNFIRFYVPFIILPILIIIFLFVRSKKIDILTSLFIIYFCWQLVAFFFSNRQSDSYIIFNELRTIGSNIFYSEFEEALFNNLNLIFCSLSILIILTIANNLNLKTFNKKIFIITLGFIGLIAIYFTFQLIDESIKNDAKFIYFSSALMADSITFNQANPRVTGLSRMLLIFYFLFFFFLLKSHKKISWYIILLILILLLYKMQTRGAFIGIIMLYIVFFFFSSIKLKKKLLNLLALVIVPIIIFETYYFIKKNYNVFNVNDFKSQEQKILTQEQNTILEHRRLFKNETSGRYTIWKNALFIIDEKKIILGYGPQADRFLFFIFRINYKDKNIYYDKNGNPYLYDNNVSNSLIYSYLCGGIVGFFLLLSIYLIVIIVVLKNIFVNKIFFKKNNLWLNFSNILMIYLGFRGIFENSFSVFGIDYIFFILAYLSSKNLLKSTR
jgi:hypothetical protein